MILECLGQNQTYQVLFQAPILKPKIIGGFCTRHNRLTVQITANENILYYGMQEDDSCERKSVCGAKKREEKGREMERGAP